MISLPHEVSMFEGLKKRVGCSYKERFRQHSFLGNGVTLNLYMHFTTET